MIKWSDPLFCSARNWFWGVLRGLKLAQNDRKVRAIVLGLIFLADQNWGSLHFIIGNISSPCRKKNLDRMSVITIVTFWSFWAHLGPFEPPPRSSSWLRKTRGRFFSSSFVPRACRKKILKEYLKWWHFQDWSYYFLVILVSFRPFWGPPEAVPG